MNKHFAKLCKEDRFRKKLIAFYDYVGQASMVDNAEHYALSIGNLQLHDKLDFNKAFEIIKFLVADRKFIVPNKIKEDLFEDFVKSTGGELVKKRK